MGPDRAFWEQQCSQRGPALSHIHYEHIGDDPNIHIHCPCRHCGLTPERWAQMVHYTTAKAGLVDPDSQPLTLEQTPRMREPGLARRQCSGPETGPGRGPLSREWMSWARIALSPVDAEYR